MLIIILIIAIISAGCATHPPIPEIESRIGDRIGVFVQIADNPTYMQFGFLGMSEKTYPYHWNLNAEVNRTVMQSVRNAGLTAVDLTAEGIGYFDLFELIEQVGDTWQLKAGKEGTMRRLHDELHLKAIIFLTKMNELYKNRVLVDSIFVYRGSSIPIYADASGLYSANNIFFTLYKAVAAFNWHVFVLEPLADTAKAPPLLDFLWTNSAIRLWGFNDPVDSEHLTEAEFAPVKAAILRSTELATVEAIKTLHPK